MLNSLVRYPLVMGLWAGGCVYAEAAPREILAVAYSTPVQSTVNSTACAAAEPKMIPIPVGTYRPFFKTKDGKRAAVVSVNGFQLDTEPVTRGAFLNFVCRHPQWRKSRVKALFAEENYLTDWVNDLDPGQETLQKPVTSVSWFAARAYCAARNGRLPTIAEWERTAGVEQSNQIPAGARAASPFRFAMGQRAPDLAHSDLEFRGIWEWNADFNAAIMTARSGNGENPAASLFCGDGFRSTNAADYGAFLRYSFRSSLRADYTLKNLGFRCAGDLP